MPLCSPPPFYYRTTNNQHCVVVAVAPSSLKNNRDHALDTVLSVASTNDKSALYRGLINAVWAPTNSEDRLLLESGWNATLSSDTTVTES